MVQIIERPETAGQRLARGLHGAATTGASQVSQMLMQRQQQEAENEAIKRLTGKDVGGLPPELKQEFVKGFISKKESKEAEKREMIKVGLDTVGQMRQVLSKGNLGRGSAITGFFGGETAQDREHYKALGRSLIPIIAAGVPIRNQKEFEEYRSIITDPSATEGQIKGALDGIEDIFSRVVGSAEENIMENEDVGPKPPFNPNNPEHQAKASQLFKQFKDKEKVRQKLRLEFGGV